MKILLSLLGSVVMFAGAASAFELRIGPNAQDLKFEFKKNKANEIKKIDIKKLIKDGANLNCGEVSCISLQKND